ncbi:MAG: DoxX family protein [Pirellulales bacterium]
MDSRRSLGGFAILALVLLRLAIGWHFFTAGMEKIERTDDGYRVAFTAAPFLGMAKGPFADTFKSLAPSGHDWQQLLAVPHQKKTLTAEEAKTAGDNPPYKPWVDRIKADWQAVADKAAAVPGLTEDQVARVKAAFAARVTELDAYLQGETAAIADYQHELWRLDQWRAKPEATTLPFEQERITKKQADTAVKAKAWVAGVASLEQGMIKEFRNVVEPNQKTVTMAANMETATTGPEEASLQRVNMGATILTLGVGVCLLLGMFTRTASIVGALFLLSVIATQPPWVATAEPTINQTVELAGLLVLAGTGAGRWLGLDFFSWALFHRNDD